MAMAFSVALYEEGRFADGPPSSPSSSVGPAINLVVWRAGWRAAAVPLWSPSLANYDCWFLLVSWGLVWSRRRIVARARRDSATMAINETRWNDGRKEVGRKRES